MNKRTIRNIVTVTAIGAGIAFTASIAGRLFIHTMTDELVEYSNEPATDYATALARFAALQALDNDTINPLCHSTLLTHDGKVERVIVLIHGITNCPQQFAELGSLFHQQGYNVLIPRMPHNGLTDRMTNDLKYLTAIELRNFSNAIADIACGLGEHVTFVGLSAGGVLTAWIAQYRTDVDKAVLIAPSLGIGRLLTQLNSAAVDLFLTLPDIATQYISPFRDGPNYSYLGYSTHALAEVMRLGASVYRSARKTKPAVQSILLVTNANDPAVNNRITWELVDQWHKKGLKHLEAYEFKAEHYLGHDIIDPHQPDQQTSLVYPILLDLITRTESSSD